MSLIALRRIVGTLRQERCPAREVRKCAQQLFEVLQRPKEEQQIKPIDHSFLLQVSLCFNLLSKRSAAVDPGTWTALAAASTPLLPSLPVRRLALILNAFARVGGAPRAWLGEAALAVQRAAPASLSSQDLLQILSAFAKLAHVEEGVILRLVRDDAPLLVEELAPQGLAGVAHAAARLGAALPADSATTQHLGALLKALAPQVAHRLQELGPLELALVTDAFARPELGRSCPDTTPPWAEALLDKVTVSLVPVLPALGAQEAVMTLTALSRRTSAAVAAGELPGLASGLVLALERVAPELTGAELALSVHSAARLALDRVCESRLASMLTGEGLAPAALLDSSFRPAHLALLVHGLAKLQLQPAASVWRLASSEKAPTPFADRLDAPNAVRTVLAAAKADWRDAWMRRLADAVLWQLGELGAEALTSLIYARLHPYYLQASPLCVLLCRANECLELGEELQQSFDPQVRAGLLAFQMLQKTASSSLCGQLILPAARQFANLAWRTDSKNQGQQLSVQQSDMQMEVERTVAALLGDRLANDSESKGRRRDGEQFLGSTALNSRNGLFVEVLAWPFTVDIVVLQKA